jgi:hypothetical protein
MAKGDARVTRQTAKKPAVATRAPAWLPPADKPIPSRPPLTKPARLAKGSTPPGAQVTSRTKTLDDPMTTSLLAEIARRPATADVLPEQLAAALDISRRDRDPDDST